MITYNIISNNPRNYYIDTLINSNNDLYYDEDQLVQ